MDMNTDRDMDRERGWEMYSNTDPCNGKKASKFRSNPFKGQFLPGIRALLTNVREGMRPLRRNFCGV
jgi:hypothetical protein